MKVTVTGDAGYKAFATSCRDFARTGLDKELDRGLREAGEDIAQAVRTSSDIFMPSGYEELFRSRLLSKVEPIRVAVGHGVTVIIYARGRSGRRDVERLEQGILRHPVYGRYRTLKSGKRQANPWTITKIRPGFHSVPVAFASPRAVKRIDTAVGRALEKIHT